MSFTRRDYLLIVEYAKALHNGCNAQARREIAARLFYMAENVIGQQIPPSNMREWDKTVDEPK